MGGEGIDLSRPSVAPRPGQGRYRAVRGAAVPSSTGCADSAYPKDESHGITICNHGLGFSKGNYTFVYTNSQAKSSPSLMARPRQSQPPGWLRPPEVFGGTPTSPLSPCTAPSNQNIKHVAI